MGSIGVHRGSIGDPYLPFVVQVVQGQDVGRPVTAVIHELVDAYSGCEGD